MDKLNELLKTKLSASLNDMERWRVRIITYGDVICARLNRHAILQLAESDDIFDIFYDGD